MPEGTYNAGTIFLQVVPVFGDMMRQIQSQAKDMNKSLGDEMEKGGAEAGTRAGKAAGDNLKKEMDKSGREAGKSYAGSFNEELDKALAKTQREMKPLKFKAETSEVLAEVAALDTALKRLKDPEIRPKMSAERLYAEVAKIQASFDALDHQVINVRTRTDLSEARKSLDAFLARVEKANPTLVPQIDTRAVDRAAGYIETKFRKAARSAADALSEDTSEAIAEIKGKFAALSDLSITPDLNTAEVRAEMAALAGELLEMARNTDLEFDVRADAGKAYGELLAVNREAASIDGKHLEITVGVGDVIVAEAQLKALNSELRRSQDGFSIFKAGGDEAANSFRSFNGLILAAVTLLPAMVPVLGAVGGALIAIVPSIGAVAGGIGALVFAFTGIGQTVKDMNAQDAASAKDSLTQAKTMRTAAQSVADARRSLSRAEASAAEGVRSALEQQKNAEQSLADAQRDATKAQQDLVKARQQARQDLQDLNNDVAQNKIDVGQRRIDLFNAKTAYDATMNDGSSTALDKDQALYSLQQAQLAYKEAEQQQDRLAKQKKKADKTGVEGTDTVKNAEDQLVSALEREKNAQQAVGDAARDVRKAQVQGAQQVGDAQRALTRAQQSYNDALTQTGTIGSSSAAKVAQDMQALGPAGREFARYIFSLRDGFYQVRGAVQAAILPPIETAMKKIMGKYGPDLMKFVLDTARTVGKLIDDLATNMLNSPVWERFFENLGEIGPTLLKAFGHATISGLDFFVKLMNIAAPYAVDLAKAVARIADSAARWIESKQGAQTLRDFLDYAERVGPAVAGFFWDLFTAIINIGKGAASYGDTTLGFLDHIAKFIGGMDPKTLGGIVRVVLGVAAAFQVAVGAVAALNAGQAARGTFLSRWLLYGGALVTILWTLYDNFGFVRAALKPVVDLFTTGLPTLGPWVKWIALLAGAVWAGIAAWRAYQAVTAIAMAAQLGLNGTILTGTGYTTGQMVVNRIAAGATKAWAVATKIAAAAQRLLNAAFLSGPWGWIVLAIVAVVAALVYLFKNNKTVHDALVKAWNILKAVASAVFGAIGDAAEWLWKKAIQPAFSAIANIVGGVFGFIQDAWNDVLSPVFSAIFKVVEVLFKAYFKVYFILIKALVKGTFLLFREVWKTIGKPVFDALGDVVKWLWKNVFKPNVDLIKDIWNDLFNGMKWAWDHVLSPVFDAIGTAVGKLAGLFGGAKTDIGKVWDGIKGVIEAPIKWVVSHILNHGIIDGFNKLAKWVGVDGFGYIGPDDWHADGGIYGRRKAAYATGGVLPGYTPGVDVHHFTSPTGGRLHLSGGEAIMRPEWTKAMGPGYVSYMNALARRQGVGGIRKALGGGSAFASGGIFDPDAKVYINGMAISKIAAAQVALAKQTSGIPIYMIQGGFGGNHVAASGTSHNYPGVGDFGPGSIALEKILREVGFAAWARNIAGRSSVGSGAHVHAISLLDPGDQGSPQVYGSWPNHGNGLSGYNNDPAPHYPLLPNLAAKLAEIGIPGVHELASLFSGPSSGFHLPSIPGWVKDIVTNPLGYVKGLISKPVDAFKNAMGTVSESGLGKTLIALPGKVIQGVTSKLWSIIPGWVKDTLNAPVKLVEGVKHGITSLNEGEHDYSDPGPVPGLALGGIIPHNGTMMYDNGGYLPPGITQVVNLTGKPEPVFTSDQFDRMSPGSDGGFHYEPHFEGSDLTASDVAQDIEFTYRRMKRGGKYGSKV